MTDTVPETWFDLSPERLTWELDEFERHGLSAEVSYDNERRLIVTSQLRFRGEPLLVTAVYSHGHPELPPTISSDRYVLDRHQDPIGKNFCLLEDANEDWQPRFSAAQLIGKSLRRLLRDFEAGKPVVLAAEADMPEPVSAQFPYTDDRLVLVPDPFLAMELGAKGGTMTVLPGYGLASLLADAAGIGAVEPSLLEAVDLRRTSPRSGRWVSLDTAPRPENAAEDLLVGLGKGEGEPLERLERKLRQNKRLAVVTSLVGVTFREEGPRRLEERRTWIFVEIEQRRGSDVFVKHILRTQALSRTERARRVPELTGLDKVHVVIVGAGSLGAPVALELVKAGVGELDLFDNDAYDVNNAVRHVLTLEKAGEPKAASVAELCRSLNPFVRVRGHDHMIGSSQEAAARLEEALKTASLVIDTTGLGTVARFLSSRTKRAGVPLIVTGLTAGSLGADLFFIAPGGTCLDCFEAAQAATRIPAPPQGEVSSVTPIGCRHPAFSGAGFEATELSAIISRRAVQAVGVTSYGSTSSNWVVINFRGGSHYEEGYLPPDENCPSHP